MTDHGRLELRHDVDRQALAAAHQASEGVGKLTMYLLGALLTIIVAMAGFAINALQSQISALVAIEASRGERLGALESRVQAADARISSLDTALDRRLTRIEQKLDDVLARRP
jgi:hypothetical protein